MWVSISQLPHTCSCLFIDPCFLPPEMTWCWSASKISPFILMMIETIGHTDHFNCWEFFLQHKRRRTKGRKKQCTEEDARGTDVMEGEWLTREVRWRTLCLCVCIVYAVWMVSRLEQFSPSGTCFILRLYVLIKAIRIVIKNASKQMPRVFMFLTTRDFQVKLGVKRSVARIDVWLLVLTTSHKESMINFSSLEKIASFESYEKKVHVLVFLCNWLAFSLSAGSSFLFTLSSILVYKNNGV